MKSNGIKGNILTDFAKWLFERGKAEGTIKTYLGVLEQFQTWLPYNKDIAKIKKIDIQNYMTYLEEEQKSAGTIEKIFSAISVFVRFLGNPQMVLGIHKKEKLKANENPETLGETERLKLLSEVEADGNLRNTAIVYTLLHTGIRISELCALNRSDIELNNKSGKLLIRNKKGDVERISPLSRNALIHIQKYIASLNIEEEALFVSNNNKRITARAVQYMLRKYNVNPHKLRHTFCQNLINNGVDIQTVAILAGHRDVNVTKRYSKDKNIMDLENVINQTFAN